MTFIFQYVPIFLVIFFAAEFGETVKGLLGNSNAGINYSPGIQNDEATRIKFEGPLLAACLEEKKQMESKNNFLESQNAAITNMWRSEKDQNAIILDQVSQVQSSCISKEIKLSTDNTKLSEDLVKLQTQISNLETRNLMTENEKTSVQNQLDALNLLHAGQQGDSADSQKTLVAVQAEMTALKTENQNLKTEKHILKTENQGLKTDSQSLKTENQNLTAENQILKTENPKLMSENRVLKTEEGNLKTENQNLKIENQSVKRDNQNVMKEKNLIESQLAESQKETTDLKTSCKCNNDQLSPKITWSLTCKH